MFRLKKIILFLLVFTTKNCNPKEVNLDQDIYLLNAHKTISISMDTEMLAGKKKWIGSGFLISEDGLALTCLHVITQTKPFVVRQGGKGKRYFAKLIAEDPTKDLALIRLDSKDSFSYFSLATNEFLKRGEEYYTISSPFGLEDSFSKGIISDPKRLEVDISSPNLSYVQTNSPILEGSSGAALFDKKGNMIGIAQFQWRNTDYKQSGIGFALRTSHLIEFVSSVKNTGLSKDEIQAGIIEIPIITDYLVQKLKLPTSKGLLVSYVVENSAAARAGLRRHDFIIALDGKEVLGIEDWKSGILKGKGNRISIEYIRESQKERTEIIP